MLCGLIFTLCMYAQQGYVFDRVGLCMYVYMHVYVLICGLKTGCLWSYCLKSVNVNFICPHKKQGDIMHNNYIEKGILV